MSAFTASNGIKVSVDLLGGLKYDASGLLLDMPAMYTQAAREFFEHEKDEKRGVWRSKDHPGWTAIRKRKVVYFQHEDHERSFQIVVGNDASLSAWSGDLVAVARDYLDAHPEPKPWEDAQPGEVWVLTFSEEGGGGTEAWTVNRDRRFVHPHYVSTPALTDSTIVAAHRVWPEVTE